MEEYHTKVPSLDGSFNLEEISSGVSVSTNSGRTSPEEKSFNGSLVDEGYFEKFQNPAQTWLFDGSPDATTIAEKSPVDAWECQNLHLLWQRYFHDLFRPFVHRWSLLGSFDEPAEGFQRFAPLQVHEDIAKVRFFCPDCLRAWTSMRGKVVFWFGLDFHSGEGVVVFKLFGQRCKDCSSDFFEPAMWYPEEVRKVIDNVFEKVRCQFYPRFIGGAPSIPLINQRRRHGRPKGNHNRDLCHACLAGHCRSIR